MAGLQFQTERNRLASFVGWPDKASVSCLTLAKNGFYYNGSSLMVICWSCQKTLDIAIDGGNFKHKHRILSPACGEIANSASNNIPLQLPDLNIQPRGFTETDDSSKVSNLQSLLEQVCQRAVRRGIFESPETRISLLDPDFDVLRRELIRLKTFHNWPSENHVNPEDLAQAGFFFTEVEDQVQCAFCRNVCANWKPGDDPLNEHRRQFPDCPFARGDIDICSNVPRHSDFLECDVEPMATNLYQNDSMVDDSRHALKNQSLPAETPVSGQLSECSQRAKHPEMRDEIQRRQTFSQAGALIPKGQRPEDLVEAGFYYIGPLDYCKCFFCGGGLKNWQEDDNPWYEHARWYPCCEYIKSKKGWNFIITTQNDKSAHVQQIQQRFGVSLQASVTTLPDSKNKVPKTELEGSRNGHQSLQRPKAEGASNHNSPQPKAHSNSKNKNKNKKKRKAQSNKTEKPSDAHQEETKMLEMQEATVNQENLLESPEDIENSLQEENRLLKEVRTCKICMKGEANTVFLPCGHLVSCEECAQELRLCLICRSVIRGTVKTFLA